MILKLDNFKIAIILFILFSSFTHISFSKDNPTAPKVCHLEIDSFDCSSFKIKDCNSMSIEILSHNVLGWPTLVKYSGCGKSGTCEIEYESNGCIKGFNPR